MKNREKNFISAVIYVHNAERRIACFLKMLVSVLEEYFEHSEIICVNDASQDASVEQIRMISGQTKRTNITVLHMSYFHGIELAMNAGVDLAIGDFVFEFDSVEMDYSCDTIIEIYRKALEGYDIVSAIPDKKHKVSSAVFYRIFQSFANDTYKMDTERFRILSRRVINRISSMNKSVPYRKAIYANCGLKKTNIIYKITDRTISDTGVKKDRMETKYRGRLAVDALILFTDIGYRFSVVMTFLMMLIAVFMVVYSLIVYVTSSPVAGWTTTILFLAVAFFGLFGVLTIVIKYLQILIDLVFKRSRYSFESIEKLTK